MTCLCRTRAEGFQQEANLYYIHIYISRLIYSKFVKDCDGTSNSRYSRYTLHRNSTLMIK